MTAQEIWDALRAAQVTHVVGLPDTQTDRLFAGACGPGPTIVRVCREGETFGIAAGLWAGGGRPVILMQSTGLFEAGDALRSFHLELEVPLDLVLGWRGRNGKLNAGYADTAAEILLPTLDAWRVPWEVIEDDLAADSHEALPTGADSLTGSARRLAEALRAGAGRERGGRAYLLPQ